MLDAQAPVLATAPDHDDVALTPHCVAGTPGSALAGTTASDLRTPHALT